MVLKKRSEFIETNFCITIHVNASENCVNFVLNQVVSMLLEKVGQVGEVYEPFVMAVYSPEGSLD
jgi:hypothetical protein